MFEDPAGFRVGNMAAEMDVTLRRDGFVVLQPWAAEPEGHFVWYPKGLGLIQVSVGLMCLLTFDNTAEYFHYWSIVRTLSFTYFMNSDFNQSV
jgi:hypothetical protein